MSKWAKTKFLPSRILKKKLRILVKIIISGLRLLEKLKKNYNK